MKMRLLHAAAEAFPLDYNVRALPAYALVQFGAMMPPGQVIREIDKVLANDPSDVSLRLDREMEEARRGGR